VNTYGALALSRANGSKSSSKGTDADLPDPNAEWREYESKENPAT